MKFKSYISISLLVFLVIGCIPNETPVKPHEKGNVTTGYVEMGNLYVNQIYFSLEKDTVVSTNKITSWDLAFCSYPDSFAILLNGGCFESVYNTKKVNFNGVTPQDTVGIDPTQWQYDNPFGKLDSTAIGTWWESKTYNQTISKSEVYILNRGVTERTSPRGFYKIQIEGFENNQYYIKVAKLDGSNSYEFQIPKDPTRNFVAFSCDKTGSLPPVEPPSNQWDLCFVKYTELLYTDNGVPTWYSVTGPLINPISVSVAIADSTKPFEQITYDDLKNYTFSNNINAIGYDWKTFNLSRGFYVINTAKVYFIQTQYGYYKLHFVDFYNATGEKGYPKFEYQKL